jgi:hypothetical protein
LGNDGRRTGSETCKLRHQFRRRSACPGRRAGRPGERRFVSTNQRSPAVRSGGERCSQQRAAREPVAHEQRTAAACEQCAAAPPEQSTASPERIEPAAIRESIEPSAIDKRVQRASTRRHSERPAATCKRIESSTPRKLQTRGRSGDSEHAA